MIGGITFFFGSLIYYPSLDSKYNGDVVGGWLFTIGSFTFLLADITEWNFFRTGCLGSYDMDPLNTDYTINAKFKRAEIGLNFFISVFGSFLYLIGSIMFIPSTNSLL